MRCMRCHAEPRLELLALLHLLEAGQPHVLRPRPDYKPLIDAPATEPDWYRYGGILVGDDNPSRENPHLHDPDSN